MALQLSYTDIVNNQTYPQSYWRIGRVVFERQFGERISFMIHGYGSIELRESGISENVLARKTCLITGLEAEEIVSGDDVMADLYQYLKTYKEGPPPQEDENGETPEDTRLAFFADAIDV